MTNPGPERRIRLRHVLRATGFALISALVVVDHVALVRGMREVQLSTNRVEGTALERLAALEEQLETVARQPPAVSEASFATMRQALDERLVALEQAIRDRGHAADLAALQAHLARLEARIAQRRRTPPAAPPPPPVHTAEPAATEPPFRLLGAELRGGERFLLLLPLGADSLSQVQLLRVGETHGDWRLEALDEKAASFRIDGRVQRLELP